MSPRTVFLAELFGVYLTVVALSMLIRQQEYVEVMVAITRNPSLLYIAGLMGFTAGLATVLSHNVWSGGALPVVVTLFGWISLVKGILLLVLSPEREYSIFIEGLHYGQHPSLYAGLPLLIGAYLAYSGFTASTRDQLASS
jgi:hypothetical protein